jgi:hypothetical protein
MEETSNTWKNISGETHLETATEKTAEEIEAEQ